MGGNSEGSGHGLSLAVFLFHAPLSELQILEYVEKALSVRSDICDAFLDIVGDSFDSYALNAGGG